jgi:hypothetical protein
MLSRLKITVAASAYSSDGANMLTFEVFQNLSLRDELEIWLRDNASRKIESTMGGNGNW